MSDPNYTIDPERARRISEYLGRPGNESITNRQAARDLGYPESAIRRARAAKPPGARMRVRVSEITADPEVQRAARAAMTPEAVAHYGDLQAEGKAMPPVVAFRESPARLWLAGGFHRHAGAAARGVEWIEAEVREGGRRDAILYAASSNQDNGVFRTTADKARSIATLLGDAEWSRWSDARIAAHVGCDPKTVGKHRQSMPGISRDEAGPERRLAVRDGKEYEVTVPAPRPKADPGRPAGPAPGAPAEFEGDDPEVPGVPTDGEWLSSLQARARLSDRCREVFDADALAYRKLVGSPAYVEAANLARRLVSATNKNSFRGEFLYRTSAYFDLKHPRSWLPCGGCEGKGCDTCRRRGYAIS